MSYCTGGGGAENVILQCVDESRPDGSFLLGCSYREVGPYRRRSSEGGEPTDGLTGDMVEGRVCLTDGCRWWMVVAGWAGGESKDLECVAEMKRRVRQVRQPVAGGRMSVWVQ